jgi:TRAP-type C4-dicarboxylate transport system permease small subunit
MKAFSKLVEKLTVYLKMFGAACLTGMMLLTCTDVIGRVFKHPILGTEEIVGLLAALAMSAAMPYTHAMHAHVGVDMIVKDLSPKAQAVIDSLTNIIAFILFLLMGWQSWLYALDLKHSGQVSMTLQLPSYYVVFFLSFCFFAFCAVILVEIFQHIHKAVNA